MVSWLGLHRRSNRCTKEYSKFWERKITDSREIQRSYADISSLFFDRSKMSLQILKSSLLMPSHTLLWRSWQAGVHRLPRLFPQFSSIPLWYDASSAAGKSCELDPVPSWVIQKFADKLSPFVAALFNALLSSGSFPTSQKTASILPVLKKVILDLCNYRTISNQMFLSELLEHMAPEQIIGYLDSFHFLP